MKWVGLIVLMFISLSAFCVPRDSARVAQRKQAKIEKEKRRIEQKWDERSRLQKSKDRRAIIFMAISAAVLLNTLAHKE